jgi:hypothetical protein
MKTRIQTLNDYLLKSNVGFAEQGNVLDLLYNRDSDIADFLTEMLNDYENLSNACELETDKKMFRYKKEAILNVLEEMYLAL